MLHFHLAVHRQEISRDRMVKITKELCAQADWWSTALKASVVFSPIVHPDLGLPSNAVEAFSDVAGGTKSRMGAGLGAVASSGEWTYLPWPAWLNNAGVNSDGVRFVSKLSCLEGLGPLAALCMMGRAIVRALSDP